MVCCVDIILDEYNYLIFWHEKNETSVYYEIV